MTAPFTGSSTIKQEGRRTKTKPPLSGEDFGLVPSKYLKRLASEDSDNRISSIVSSIPFTGGTPPRKPKLQDAMSPSPQQQNVLKDIEVDIDILSKTPQERFMLQEELNRSLAQRGANIIQSSFVDEWKTACLRAEAYDVARTTLRIMHHWRLKSELFGTPDLKVTIGDIAPNLVHSGIIQLAPTRDLAGRSVVCMKFDSDVYSSQEREVSNRPSLDITFLSFFLIFLSLILLLNLIVWYIPQQIKKYLFYMLASALEDEETQDKGIVLLVWNPPHKASTSIFPASPSSWGSFFDSFWNLWKSVKTSFRITRLHYATTSSDVEYSMKEYEEHDTLIRHHNGSSQECLHALLTFGIPIPSLPITPDCIQTNFHLKWVEWRHRTDSYHHQHHYKIVLVPTRLDVLFGKHSPVNAGNIRFHQMILANVEEYRRSKASEQCAIRTQIYKSLTNALPGGNGTAKFLHPLDARMGLLWEPMDEKSATAKISDAFQYICRQLDHPHDQSSNSDGGSVDPRSDFTDFVWMKQCCFMITCKDGYHLCGDSSQLSSKW